MKEEEYVLVVVIVSVVVCLFEFCVLWLVCFCKQNNATKRGKKKRKQLK